MFEFGDDAYQWCHACRGNVRKGAYVCRFCKTRIGSKLLKGKQAEHVGHLVDEVAGWTGKWDDTFQALPEPLRRRLLMADAETPAPYIGLEEGVTPEEARERARNSVDGINSDPPGAATSGLLWDLLLAIDEKNSAHLDQICELKTMRWLGVTAEQVREESRRRRDEYAGGIQCKHCAEYVQSQNPCRFCGGTESDAPAKTESIFHDDIGALDPDLLRRIILFEVAKHKLDPDEKQLVSAELQQKYKISDDEIEREILRQRQDPRRLPWSPWRQRMVELEIELFAEPEYFAFMDLFSLAHATSLRELYDEADVVHEHALTRWSDSKHFEGMRYPLMRSRASLYLSKGDYGKYQELNREAAEEMPPDQRNRMRDANRALETNFMAQSQTKNEDVDPLEVFEKQMQELEETKRQTEESLKSLEDQVPGLSEMLRALQDNLMNKTMELQRLTAEAQSAAKKGDHERAATKYQSLVDSLDESDGLDAMKKTIALCDLAKELQQLERNSEAEEKLLQALQLAKDIMEVEPLGFELAGVTRNYAIFLKDAGRNEEAHAMFKKAVEAQEKFDKNQIAKYKSKPESLATGMLLVKEAWLELLEKLNLKEDAKRIKKDIAALKAQVKEWEQRNAQNRRAFLEGLPAPD